MPQLGGNTSAGSLSGTEQVPLLDDTYTTVAAIAAKALADPPAARLTLGLGSAALVAVGSLASADQGARADSALQPTDLSAYALKESPTFTGTPTAPTQTAGNSSTRLATTAFVAAAVSGLSGGGSATNLAASATADAVTVTSDTGTDATIAAATAVAAGVMVATDKAKLDGLHAVATSGAYGDLSGKPTIAPPAPSITKTASHTAALVDAGKFLRMDVATANSFTVPPDADVAFPIDTEIHVRQVGVGATTIVAGAGVTLTKPASQTLVLNEQYSVVTLKKEAANTWAVFGHLA